VLDNVFDFGSAFGNSNYLFHDLGIWVFLIRFCLFFFPGPLFWLRIVTMGARFI
jgi:hypothetical protein